MARRWGNPRYVQDMWELLAKLEGELSRDAANGEARGIQVILVTTDGVHRLDPDAFRAAAAEREGATRGHPEGGSRWPG